MKVKWIIGTVLMSVAASRIDLAAAGVETRVMVRAISRDAKVISSNVGGARITIRDVTTGKVLAEGVQKGGSGDTALIMTKPRARGATVFNTPDTAGFLAVLSLARPTVVEVIAEGPLGLPQCTQRVTKTLLLVPGEHVEGEGVLLEIQGFCVSLLTPISAGNLALGHALAVEATVTMS